jgi:hypothetical protein
MIANVLLSVSTALLLIAVVDIFLSDKQKDKISLAFTEEWNKLDDMAKLPYGALLTNTKAVVISATITFVVGSITLIVIVQTFLVCCFTDFCYS